MKNNLFVLIISLPFILNAQTVISQNLSESNFASRGDYRMQESYMTLVNRLDESLYVNEANVSGSKYFNNSFLLGKVFVNNNASKELFAVRYNAYFDLIEVKKENTIEALIKAINISCYIAGKLYVYLKYLPNKSDTGKLGYLKVIHVGEKITLLKQELVKYKEAKPAKTSLTSSIPAKFIKYENYFYLTKNKDIALALTKKSIIEAFNITNKSELKSFLKKEKIDIKKESDLIKLFSYYDTLDNNLN
jgi:hypothetical protein